MYLQIESGVAVALAVSAFLFICLFIPRLEAASPLRSLYLHPAMLALVQGVVVCV
jgi:hypothetical protein